MLIYSHNAYSEGAKALKLALGAKKIKNEGSLFKGAAFKKVINWGSTELPKEIVKCTVINKPDAIALTVNKLSFFNKIIGNVWCPEFTTDLQKALEWLGAGHEVVARTVLNGSGGKGIIMMDKGMEKFPKAPLYVKYIPKTEEYRIHIVRNKLIDVQRKTLNKAKLAELGIAAEDINFKVRNLENGFIYQRENVHPDQTVLNAAAEAVAVSGLDFGAVDLVVHSKTKKPYVLEINTAPGLQGQTVDNYAKAFKELF